MKTIIISAIIGGLLSGYLTYKAWHGKPFEDDMVNSILAGLVLGATIGIIIVYW